jgi:hypothetical protein
VPLAGARWRPRAASSRRPHPHQARRSFRRGGPLYNSGDGDGDGDGDALRMGLGAAPHALDLDPPPHQS